MYGSKCGYGWLAVFRPFYKCNLFILPYALRLQKIQTIDAKEPYNKNGTTDIFKKFNGDVEQKRYINIHISYMYREKEYLNLIISLFTEM